MYMFFFLLIRLPPRSTLFPYTTLFRSLAMTYIAKSRLTKPSLATRALLAVVSRAGEPFRFGWEPAELAGYLDRKSTRLNSSHSSISYAVFCLKKKKRTDNPRHAY